jgi:hypothetical protein
MCPAHLTLLDLVILIILASSLIHTVGNLPHQFTTGLYAFSVRCLITTFNHQNSSFPEPTSILVDDWLDSAFLRNGFQHWGIVRFPCFCHGATISEQIQTAGKLSLYDSCDDGLVCFGIEFTEIFLATGVSAGSTVLAFSPHNMYIIPIKVLAMPSDSGQ